MILSAIATAASTQLNTTILSVVIALGPSAQRWPSSACEPCI